ncbi:MAG TPA: hypothetical protein VIR29_00380 [Anseongella sp.]
MVEQAEETLKSEYSLELLGLVEPVRERELENKMINREVQKPSVQQLTNVFSGWPTAAIVKLK